MLAYVPIHECIDRSLHLSSSGNTLQLLQMAALVPSIPSLFGSVAACLGIMRTGSKSLMRAETAEKLDGLQS